MTNSKVVQVRRSYVVFGNAKIPCLAASVLLTLAYSASAQVQPPASTPPGADSNQTPAVQTTPSTELSPAGSPVPGAASAEPVATQAPAAPEPVPAQPTGVAAAASETPLEPAEPIPPPAAKTFMASIFSLRLEFGGGGPFGDLIDEEKNAQVSATYSDGSVKTATPSHGALHGGVNLEIAPLRRNNFKLALRAGYLYTEIRQSAEVGGGQYEVKKWDGQLLGMNAGLFGPVVYFGKKWYGSFQLLVGPLSGTLHPIPLGEQIAGLNVPDYSVSGWMLRAGPGFGYAWKTLLVGGDLLYSRSSISFKEVVYTNIGTSTSLSTISISGYVGLHL